MTLPNITPRSSLKELEDAYRKHFSPYPHWYAKDHDFIQHVFDGITSASEIWGIVREMEQEHKKYGTGSECTKVRLIKQALDELTAINMLRYRLAYIRRVCCWCHESGSLALRREYVVRQRNALLARGISER